MDECGATGKGRQNRWGEKGGREEMQGGSTYMKDHLRAI